VVINFTSNQDLIAQLRQVKTGHVVETHFTGSTEPVSSGLQCSDPDAASGRTTVRRPALHFFCNPGPARCVEPMQAEEAGEP